MPICLAYTFSPFSFLPTSEHREDNSKASHVDLGLVFLAFPTFILGKSVILFVVFSRLLGGVLKHVPSFCWLFRVDNIPEKVKVHRVFLLFVSLHLYTRRTWATGWNVTLLTRIGLLLHPWSNMILHYPDVTLIMKKTSWGRHLGDSHRRFYLDVTPARMAILLRYYIYPAKYCRLARLPSRIIIGRLISCAVFTLFIYFDILGKICWYIRV